MRVRVFQIHNVQRNTHTSLCSLEKRKKALFTKKQIFIYSVFEEKLRTDTGKHLVRKYKSQFDAQAIYKRLSEYAKESTHANQEASKLLT